MAAADLNTIRATIEQLLANEFNSLFDAIPSLDAIVSLDNPNDPGLAIVYPVVFHNMPYSPTPNSSWVQCQVGFGANEYLTMGSTAGASNNIIGIAVINVFTPAGVGSGGNFTIAKRIRDLYNRINVSGVHFDPPIGPEVVASPAPEGYFQTQVRLTFETFEDL